jgi:hypothetical protein
MLDHRRIHIKTVHENICADFGELVTGVLTFKYPPSCCGVSRVPKSLVKRVLGQAPSGEETLSSLSSRVGFGLCPKTRGPLLGHHWSPLELASHRSTVDLPTLTASAIWRRLLPAA